MPWFDSILLFDVYNYVHIGLLNRLVKYLRPDTGRIVISNMAGIGLDYLMFPGRFETNQEMLDYLEEHTAFNIEILERPTDESSDNHHYPGRLRIALSIDSAQIIGSSI